MALRILPPMTELEPYSYLRQRQFRLNPLLRQYNLRSPYTLDDHRELGRSLDRKILRLCPLQNLVYIGCCAAEVFNLVGAVTQQTAVLGGLALKKDRRQPRAQREIYDALPVGGEGHVGRNEQRIDPLACEFPERLLQLIGAAKSNGTRAIAAWAAAACVSRHCGTCSGFATLTSAARRAKRGSNSRMRSICLEASSSAKLVSPVTLPPGCERLFTKPNPTGSAPDAMTTGIVLVALAIARLAGNGAETMMFGLSATSSAARAGSFSRSPSANRYSRRTLRPSTWPRLRRPSRNASISRFKMPAAPALRKPMSADDDCCARAASGHVAAPPNSVMNARRFTSSFSRASKRKTALGEA